MKPIVRLLSIASLAALGLSGRLAAQTVTARVGGDLTGLPYSTVTIPVAVDMSASGGAKLGSYTARLSWNPAALTYCSSCSPDSLRGSFPAPQINTDSASLGVLHFTGISPQGADGLVTVAELPFSTGIDTLSTPVQLTVSEMSAAGTFTSLLPYLTVSSGAYCPARGRWGDLDGDGFANSRDALMILSDVVGIPLDPTKIALGLADVDADGRVTSRDALVILSYAVGIAIPGERVLLLAPSSCGTGSATQLAVFPTAATLVVNQPLRFVAQATDSAGHAVTVTSATWASSNYAVAGVDGSGNVVARAPGTATITAAAGPGVQASASITVVARRPNWYVDVRALGSAYEVGDSAHPFDQPSQAYALASEGDTIRVARGTYFFSSDGELNVGVVILGGTPGDTTTRPTFTDPTNSYTALWLAGGARTLVRNVAFQGFSYTVDLEGVSALALEDVRVTRPSFEGIFICGDAIVDSIRLERSVFVGDSSGDAIYDEGCKPTRLTTIRDSKILNWYDGLALGDADSTDIQGSEISNNGDYGVSIVPSDTAHPALHVSHSRIERNYYQAIYGSSFRRLVVDSSVIRATADEAIDVQGTSSGPSLLQLYLHGDSIYMEQDANDYNWLYANYGDSLVMAGTVVRLPADTGDFWAYGDFTGNQARVTNSKFLNFGQGYALDFSGSGFFADGVEMTGCLVASCDQAAGFEVYPSSSGDSVVVRRSRFSQIQDPILVQGATGFGIVVDGAVIDSALTGIQVYANDSIAVTNSVLTRIVNNGILVYTSEAPGPVGRVVIAQDSVTCGSKANGPQGVYVQQRRVLVQDNVLTGCSQAVSTYGLAAGSAVSRNTVRGSSYGIVIDQFDTVTVPVDSNAVSLTDTAAVRIYGGRAILIGNNIQNNARYGLENLDASGYVSQAHNNAFVGDSLYAVYTSSDSVDASSNWWGQAAGAGTAGADSVSSVRIATNSPLTSAPAGLPSLAPRLPVPVASVVASGLIVPRGNLLRTEAHRVKVQAPMRLAAHPTSSQHSAARLARLQQIEQLRAVHEARDQARRAQMQTLRESRRAERAAKRASPSIPRR